MNDFDELDGQKVLVTGGGKGIGKEIAMSFAKCGAIVAITGRNENALSETVEELRRYKTDCFYIKCDMREVQRVYKMVDETESGMGRVAVLVYNEGMNIAKPAI